MSPRHDAAFGPALLALTSAVGITGPDPESRTTWIHVAPFGEWNGHSAGKFSLTNDHFAAVCAQVRSKQTPVSLDYEHASIRANGEPTPAAGYVLTTEVRPDGLWALCEFTPRAAEMIKGGEYRFCSGVFDFAAKDQASGAELLCALDTIALTNRPFIDGQHPIALSRRVLAAGVPMAEIDLKALAKLLDAIPGPNTAEKVKKAIDLMSAGDAPADAPAADKAEASKPADKVVALTDPAPAVACGDMPPPAAPVAAADPPMPPMDDADNDAAVDDFDAKMMADLGISDAAAYAALLMSKYPELLAVLSGTAADATALSREVIIAGKDAQILALTKERNELVGRENARIEKDTAADVDALIKRNPSLAARRPAMIALARKSPAEFNVIASALAPVSVDLTRPHALSIAAPTDVAPPVAIPDDHPRLVAQRVSLANAGIKGDAAERVIANVRKQLAESAG